MAQLPQHPGQIIQIAWVTDDIERSIRDFASDYNVAGWAIIENLPISRLILRGEPASCPVRAAVAWRAGMMYEFIQPLDNSPSVYRGADGSLLAGFHHIAVVVDDLSQAASGYEANGYTQAMHIELENGSSAVYMEKAGCLTGMVEIMQASAMIDEFLRAVAAIEAVGSKPRIARW